MGENPAPFLQLAERDIARAISGVLFVIRIGFRYIVNADHRALVLKALAVGVLSLAKLVLIRLSQIGSADILLKNIEAAAGPAGKPRQVDQPLLFE